MKFSECSATDEIFTYSDPATGELRHFNATQMYQYAVQSDGEIELIETPLEATFAAFIRNHRGIEQWRLDRLSEPYLSRPIVIIEKPERDHLTVDGHHRYVRKHELGHTDILCHYFQLGQWERFLVEDFSEEQSSILAAQIPGRQLNDRSHL